MTLRYVFLPALCLVLSAQAQRVTLAPAQYEPSALPAGTVFDHELMGEGARAGGDVIFSDDFANGLAGNNGAGEWTVSGPDGALWMYDTDGPNGDFSATTERIQSLTVNNGFMIFDANLSNDGCTTDNSCENRTGYLMSPVLDLSATPHVQLEYTQRLRWCCSGGSGHFVDVSTDGGFSWPYRVSSIREFEHVTNFDPGTYTLRFNLTKAIEANPSEVMFRFSHETGELQSFSHYHWQVDDVKLIEAYENDLGLVNARQDDFMPWDSFTNTLDYTIYPLSQVRTISIGSPVRNEGSMEATNATLEVTVSGTAQFNGSVTVPSIMPGDIDSTLRVDFTIPAIPGPYTVEYLLSMDEEDERMEDNTASRSFMVSQNEYAYDNGARNGEYRRAATNSEDFPGYELGNLFWIENNAVAYGINVALASAVGTVLGTQVNAAFEVVLYDFSAEVPEIVAESDLVTVASGTQLTGTNQAKFFEVPFQNPVELMAGTEYAACVRALGGTPRIVVATSGFGRPVSSVVNFPELTSQSWSIVNRRPMVRLSFDQSIGMNELTGDNGVVSAYSYPNPTNGSTRLMYDLKEAAPVTIEVMDVSGKLVMSFSEGTKAPGQHQLLFDVSNLQEGVYFHVLRAGESSVTGRMVVVK